MCSVLMERAQRSGVSNKAFNEVPIHSLLALAKLSYPANRILNANTIYAC